MVYIYISTSDNPSMVFTWVKGSGDTVKFGMVIGVMFEGECYNPTLHTFYLIKSL